MSHDRRFEPPGGLPTPQFARNGQSAVVVEGIIRQGPVLSLDIDGVLAPVARGGGSPFPETPPGFVCGTHGAEAHHRMNGWLQRLAAVFPTVLWNSSWDVNALGFAETTGLDCAFGWPSIFIFGPHPVRDFIDPPGYAKIYGLATQVDPSLPLAVLDDQHAGDLAAECLLARPGPTLVVAPNSLTGIGGALVERLEAWGRNPHHTGCVMGMYGIGDGWQESPCFWRHGNCDDPHGFGTPGTGWMERDDGRPDGEKVNRWRTWWDSWPEMYEADEIPGDTT